MSEALILRGLDGSDPLGFMAALGLLRVVSREHTEARLAWSRDAVWNATLVTAEPCDPVQLALLDLGRWQAGHPAVDFAIGAHRKVQDLKHRPRDFRSLMGQLVRHPRGAAFVAAYATGAVVDSSGQTKPTSLHFTAGKQRFMDAVLNLRDNVTRDDLEEALNGPWQGRVGPKDLRWRAASDRARALLSFDPSKEKPSVVAGAVWLAFQAMPLFPVVASGGRCVTTGFTGRGKKEAFTWPLWSAPLTVHEVRVVLGLRDLEALEPIGRRRRGIAEVLRSDVVRSSQGYGNFSASRPL
ncbi:MAG TPA: hypothetical protein VMM79_18680 [Longimicrobiales bacterium]|nr:hypothetical protein [Longimicrobiales bacterium]